MPMPRCPTTACSRLPPASARASRPLPAAAEAQRSASMERRRSVSDHRKGTIMWYSTVGCLVTLTLSLLVAPLTARAQPRGKLPLTGVLEPGSQPPRTPCLPAFQQGLRDLSYVEGHNVTLVYRYAEGHSDRLPALAAELVQLAPDVIWLHANAPARAATQATTAIP